MDLEKFGEELETRAMAVERERTAPQFYSQKIFLGRMCLRSTLGGDLLNLLLMLGK